jgi:hypothetical protein
MYEYVIPADLTIRRLGVADTMSADRWAVLLDGVRLAVLDWPRARALWLGKMTLAQALAGESSPAAVNGLGKQ